MLKVMSTINLLHEALRVTSIISKVPPMYNMSITSHNLLKCLRAMISQVYKVLKAILKVNCFLKALKQPLQVPQGSGDSQQNGQLKPSNNNGQNASPPGINKEQNIALPQNFNNQQGIQNIQASNGQQQNPQVPPGSTTDQQNPAGLQDSNSFQGSGSSNNQQRVSRPQENQLSDSQPSNQGSIGQNVGNQASPNSGDLDGNPSNSFGPTFQGQGSPSSDMHPPAGSASNTLSPGGSVAVETSRGGPGMNVGNGIKAQAVPNQSSNNQNSPVADPQVTLANNDGSKTTASADPQKSGPISGGVVAGSVIGGVALGAAAAGVGLAWKLGVFAPKAVIL
ncbi:hypothetical protein BC830DRAFT_1169484 [Chytriomyces sp. MP71]|nr:hypothetical protein BC830DRAFT_1169484 [Chytriomyces sp. MP71]